MKKGRSKAARGVLKAAIVDWDTAKTVAQITFGHAIGGAILSAWYHWKAKRTDIKMVRNRRGVYVDAADMFERRALIFIWAAMALVVVAGGILLGFNI